jgi:hypothetical protein
MSNKLPATLRVAMRAGELRMMKDGQAGGLHHTHGSHS